MENPRRRTCIWKLGSIILFVFIIGVIAGSGEKCKEKQPEGKWCDENCNNVKDKCCNENRQKDKDKCCNKKCQKDKDKCCNENRQKDKDKCCNKKRQKEKDKCCNENRQKDKDICSNNIRQKCKGLSNWNCKPMYPRQRHLQKKLKRKCLKALFLCMDLKDEDTTEIHREYKVWKKKKVPKRQKIRLISNSLRVGERTSDDQDADVEVILPAELSERAEEQQNDLSRLIFSIFNDTELFEDENNSTLLNQQVFGIFLGNTSIQNLTEGVTIKINHGNTIPNGSHQCVFWFENDNDNTSDCWNSTGCNTTVEGNQTICVCNHLSYFAVLLDLRLDNNTLDESDVVALTYITMIGSGISAIFSAVTVFLYCVIRKRKGDHTTKIHINLCIACFLLNVTFLTNEWLSKLMIEGLCKTIAVFLHYSLLCTLTWMAIEGLHLYLMLIKVFNTYIKHYIQKLAFLGWGIPAVVVSLCIAVDKNNYGQFRIKTQDNNSSVSMCWITDDTVHYVTNCGFFGIIWLGNLTMLITVCVKLAQMRKGNNSGSKSVRKDLWTVLGLSYLLGITWALAFFSYGPMTVVQMYLFCILNSLQGFFIFLWYCAIKRPSKDQTTKDTSDK
ncbi:adhesion G-protein coupled receptor G5-like [Pristis pectinata]|uniref:adhesion G-protein coupled receptor G5-like n=1 Tax=Pristis pectinata TaxID=685728 RepID=UPI00223CC23B|nr:adhesion G-protein coupled receptor G5-like [Pristis pectinata]